MGSSRFRRQGVPLSLLCEQHSLLRNRRSSGSRVVVLSIPVHRMGELLFSSKGPMYSSRRQQTVERRSDFLSELARFREPAGDRTRSDLTSYLRDRITAALFLGRLAAGDRLPSLRQIATELD